MRNRLFTLSIVVAVSALAVYSAWHIYETWWLPLLTAPVVLLAALAAWITVKKRWTGWKILALVAVVWLLGGVVAMVPALLQDPDSWRRFLLGWLTSPVTGWKNLLTLELPLGTYDTVIAPWVLVSVLLPFSSLLLSWRYPRGAVGPVVIAAYPLFGMVFGSSEHSLKRQLIVGSATFVLVLGTIVLRSQWQRTAALQRMSPTDTPRRLPFRAGRFWRASLALSMLTIAGIFAVFATPLITAGSTRDVPRTIVDPEEEVERFVSPLSTFRNYFDDEEFERVMFTVEAPTGVDRIRVATLSSYDGVTARPGDHTYVRVPATLPFNGSQTVEVTVQVEEYRDVWVPVAGELAAIDMTGELRSAFIDGFFYGKTSDTGVLLANTATGVGKLVEQVAPPEHPDPAHFRPARSGPSIDEALIPPELSQWLSQQGVEASGQGLLDSVTTLRQRGYLSHALLPQEPQPKWMSVLGDYGFEASRAGHSTDRIARLFRDLNEREEELPETASDEELVAAIGDEEQFAVAAFLIADQLGFEARIGVGARLNTQDDTLSACDHGECRGEHMTAWLEVRDASSGEWAAIDVTPQHEHPPSPEVVLRSEPENPTDVDTRHAPSVPPPDPAPTEGELEAAEDEPGIGWWARVWPIIKPVVGMLLLLIGVSIPLLGVVTLKWLRASERRRLSEPRDRVVGAWDELVDRAVDTGAQRQRSSTRREYARTLRSDRAVEFADRVDEGAFAGQVVATQEAQQVWDDLDEVVTDLESHLSGWKRFRARVSLRSLSRLGERAVHKTDAETEHDAQ